MRDLAMILNRKRKRRGSIDFDLPEPVIEFDEFGMMKSITRSERNIAHRLIEEFMLSANECVAHYLENKRIASLYRIHEKPDAKRVYDFEVIAATFGYSLGVGALPIQRVQLKADRRDARGTGKRVREIEVPKEVHITPRMYQKLTEKIAGKPEERILSFLMLRSLKQARYSEENRGHFALAATTYTHFTSPIRRYPDLIVHRILKEVLRDSPEKMDEEVPVGMSPSPQDCHPERSEGPASRRTKTNGKGTTSVVPIATQKSRGFSPRGPAAIPVVQAPRPRRPSARARTSRRPHRARRTPQHRRRIQPIRTPRRRSRTRPDGMEENEIHGAPHRRRLRRPHHQRNQVRILRGTHRPLRRRPGPAKHARSENDRYTYHEDTRQIIGQRSRKTYSLGDRVRVLVDRIDPVEKKIQFAVLEEQPKPSGKSRRK